MTPPRTPRLATAAALLAALGALAACRGTDTAPARDTAQASASAPAGPPTYGFTIVHRYPHDPGAFTEGLFYQNGKLYESTGLVGKSDLRRVDLTTGAVELRRDADPKVFGEGIVAFGATLYELTWKDGKAFTFDPVSFKPRAQTFAYYGEGWALTTDGTSLVMSDGTARLRFLDPKTFAVRRTLDVHDGASPVSQLNELEWVKGEIYANLWQSEQIARIDPGTGAVVGWIDLTGLLPPAERTGREDVLNGIAYDSAGDRLFVTGKYWPTLFEIRLAKR